MKVFIAGGSGAIGVPLICALVAAGHQVTASTRAQANASKLKSLSATPMIVDALDADAMRRAVVHAQPTHVIHQLTALPKGGPKNARDLIPTNRLRIDAVPSWLPRLVAPYAGAGRHRRSPRARALAGAVRIGDARVHGPARNAVA